jgi:aryl-alcohol dehydrogenase-like predicted oxidoreductase
MEIRGPRIWGGRPVTDQQAETILNTVLDEGINFIDTANDYGRSEEFIGKFIAHRRKEFYIATKCGCTVVRKDENTDETPHVWTRDNLFRGLEESLQRMKTDYIDIMQLHNPPVEETEKNQLVEALQEMRQQGKVRFISISTTLPHLPTYLEWGVRIGSAAPPRPASGRSSVAVWRAARLGLDSGMKIAGRSLRRRIWMNCASPGKAALPSCCASRCLIRM